MKNFLFAMLMVLPLRSGAAEMALMPEGDAIGSAEAVALVSRYQLRSELGFSLTATDEVDKLIARLYRMEPRNADMVLRIVEKRHAENRKIVALRASIKGKDGSKKFNKNLIALVGEEKVGKALEVFDQAQKEEALYPMLSATLQGMGEALKTARENRKFPTGTLKRVSYTGANALMHLREMFSIKAKGDGSYEVVMTDPDARRSGAGEMCEELRFTISAEEAATLVQKMREEKLQQLPQESTSFPMELHDGGHYTFSAHFEGGTIDSSGQGMPLSIAQVHGELKKLYSLKSKK